MNEFQELLGRWGHPSEKAKSAGEKVSPQGKLLPEAPALGEFILPVLICWDGGGEAELTPGTETRGTSFHADSSRVCGSLARGNSLQEVEEGASVRGPERKNLLRLPNALYCSRHSRASDPLLLGPHPALALAFRTLGYFDSVHLGRDVGLVWEVCEAACSGLPSSHRWRLLLCGAWAASLTCKKIRSEGGRGSRGRWVVESKRLGGLVTQPSLPVLLPSIPRHKLGPDTDHGRTGNRLFHVSEAKTQALLRL